MAAHPEVGYTPKIAALSRKGKNKYSGYTKGALSKSVYGDIFRMLQKYIFSSNGATCISGRSLDHPHHCLVRREGLLLLDSLVSACSVMCIKFQQRIAKQSHADLQLLQEQAAQRLNETENIEKKNQDDRQSSAETTSSNSHNKKKPARKKEMCKHYKSIH